MLDMFWSGGIPNMIAVTWEYKFDCTYDRHHLIMNMLPLLLKNILLILQMSCYTISHVEVKYIIMSANITMSLLQGICIL